MDTEQIMELLSIGYPMVLLDQVDELNVLESARGHKAVTYNEAFFPGHFLKKPVLPAIIIIEALGQLCGVMILSAEEYRGKHLYFAKMAKVRFLGAVRPGCILELKVTKKGEGENIFACYTEASVNGEIVFTGEMHFMLVEE